MKQSDRARRTRTKIHGTAARPRLSVHISNLHIIAQLINDDTGQTLAYVSTVGQNLTGSKTTKAKIIGEQIAEKTLQAGVKTVVFDRGAKLYSNHLSALADAARAKGLEF